VTAALVLALAGGALLAARRSPPPPEPASVTAPGEYLPGRAARVDLPPAGTTTAPVVVLVPGGAWRTADPTGLLPLARSLAASRALAVTVTYRAASDGGRFPQMAADVVCAVGYAVDRARRAGITPGRVVLLGHSAGAHLAALAALAPDRLRAGCPFPPARADAFVGLAGAYDVAGLDDVAVSLFGVARGDDPALWRAGDPLTWVSPERAGGLDVLLVHGTADTAVPPSATTAFGAALRDAGARVTVDLRPGLGHGDVYRADVLTAALLRWLGLRGEARS
jgi:acetyl esterase/lipase